LRRDGADRRPPTDRPETYMKTIDLRVLVPDDVDEDLFVEQLVHVTSGPGAPYAAVQLELDGSYHEDNVELVPVGSPIVVEEARWWQGERVYPTGVEPTRRPSSSVERVQRLARELYPRS
jgi:hypothetical protein